MIAKPLGVGCDTYTKLGSRTLSGGLEPLMVRVPKKPQDSDVRKFHGGCGYGHLSADDLAAACPSNTTSTPNSMAVPSSRLSATSSASPHPDQIILLHSVAKIRRRSPPGMHHYRYLIDCPQGKHNAQEKHFCGLVVDVSVHGDVGSLYRRTLLSA